VALDVRSLANDLKYHAEPFGLDLNAFIRCLFGQLCVQKNAYLYIHQLVNGIKDMRRFLAIATLQANILQVSLLESGVWSAETDL
jgi:hypothetical protein